MKRKKIKPLLTESFPELILSDQNLRKLQKVLLMMLKDLDFVCQKYSLKYMLGGGTLLGAIRHKGFIPWDDDLDLMMFRRDYDKINDFMAIEFPDKYLVVNEFSSKYDPTTCKKIYLKGTEYVEIISENRKKPQMIFLDIFCIEMVPNSAFIRKCKGYVFDISAMCATLKAEFIYPSTQILNKCKVDKSFNKAIKFRKRLGFVANLMPMKCWYWFAKKMLEYNGTSSITGIPTGIRYNRDVLPKKVYEQLISVEFEGCHFYAPKGYDTYLKNLYGDYLKIPSVEKRERHIAVKMDFGDYQ